MPYTMSIAEYVSKISKVYKELLMPMRGVYVPQFVYLNWDEKTKTFIKVPKHKWDGKLKYERIKT